MMRTKEMYQVGKTEQTSTQFRRLRNILPDAILQKCIQQLSFNKEYAIAYF